jgi:hypothetical protein
MSRRPAPVLSLEHPQALRCIGAHGKPQSRFVTRLERAARMLVTGALIMLKTSKNLHCVFVQAADAKKLSGS